MSIVSYAIEHSTELLAIAGSIVGCASMICALTTTPKDDAWAAKVYKVIEWLALNVGKAKK